MVLSGEGHGGRVEASHEIGLGVVAAWATIDALAGAELLPVAKVTLVVFPTARVVLDALVKFLAARVVLVALAANVTLVEFELLIKIA